MKAKSNRIIENWRYANTAYFVLGFASFFYLFCIQRSSELAGGDKTEASHLIINLSFGLPEIIIWLLAARGAIRFKEYANSIRGSQDGSALNLIADAFLWLVVYVVLLTFGNQFLALARGNTIVSGMVVVKNHLPILLALISTLLFLAGARRLNAITPLRIAKRHTQLLWVLVAVFSLAFMADFLHNRPAMQTLNGEPQFELSQQALLFTYVIPYIVIWCLGTYAWLSLTNYARLVKGTIYRPLFGTLAKGVGFVFVATFLAQLLIVANVNVDKFSAVLVIIYLLLVFAAYGFLLIYKGAANLHRLEKV